MSESWNAVPRVTQFDEADFTQLNALRKKFAAAYEKRGAQAHAHAACIEGVVPRR
jgi:pyruvate dehydrogenase E2 component (dihydrolipoamide acetyltransferase)